MSTFIGVGSSVLFGNTVRASIAVLTDCIRPITEGGTIKIIGLGSGHVVTTLVEFLEALALVAAAGGGCISVAAGVYTVAATIALPSNVKIVGCGKETTIFRAAAGLNAAIFSVSGVSTVKLQDLQIDSNAPSSVVAVSDVEVVGSSGVTVDSCMFVNSANSGVGSLGFVTSFNCLVKCCMFQDMDNVGVDVADTCPDIGITDCFFSNVTNCAIDSRGDRVVIKGNHIQSSGPLCVRDGKAVVDGNTVLAALGVGVGVNGGVPPGNHVVSNNIVCDSVGAGIKSEFASFESCLIVDNIVKDSGGAGIELDDDLDSALVEGNKLTGNASGILVSTTGNDNVCVGKNKSRVLYSAAGAISPNDDEAVVTAAGGVLAMTLDDMNKCSVGHCLCIENDAASTDNVEVTYNSGSDQIVLLPTQNKVLKWNGQAWCVLNKDCFEGDLTAPPVTILFNVLTPLEFTLVSASDNFELATPGPASGIDILVRTTGKYQVNAYLEFETHSFPPPIIAGNRLINIVHDGKVWSQDSNAVESSFVSDLFLTSCAASAVVDVLDLSMPINVEALQSVILNPDGALDVNLAKVTIARL